MSLPRIAEEMIRVSNHMSSNFESCVIEHPEKFAKIHLDLNVLDAWVWYLKENKQIEAIDVLQEATWDLFSSIYSSANGLYRAAFMSIRSALELGVSFLYFYDHNYEFLLWKVDKFDIRWAHLNDPTGVEKKNAVVSPYYMNFFCPSITDKAVKLCEEIINAYRRNSQYVHGKYNYMHTKNGTQITYNQEQFEEWQYSFTEAIKVLVLLLTIRFGMPPFDPDTIEHTKELTKSFAEVWHRE